jgi:TPR repeat protein
MENRNFDELLERAIDGDVEAMVEVADAYSEGNGVEQDEERAFSWMHKAAELGDSYAQTSMGVYYCIGEVVEQDFSVAKEWYEKAAAGGNHSAMINLSFMYKDGDAVEQDEEMSFNWLFKAASEGEKGDSEAQYRVADAYYQGIGVEQNYEEALNWFEKSANNGEIDAMRKLVAMYEEGEGAEKNEELSMMWLKKAADEGDSLSQRILGWSYFNGHDIEQDYHKAKHYFEEAATKDDAEANRALGIIYANGMGVEKDNILAYQYMKKATDFGDAVAMYHHARNLLYFGEGFSINRNEGLEYARKSAEAGVIEAYRLLFQELEETNPEESLMWAKKSAECDDVGGCIELSMKYSAPPFYNKKESLAWAEKAYEIDAERSREFLVNMYNLHGHITMAAIGSGAVKYYEKARIIINEWKRVGSDGEKCRQASYDNDEYLGFAYLGERYENKEENKARAYRHFQKAWEGKKTSDIMHGIGMSMTENVMEDIKRGFDCLERAEEMNNWENPDRRRENSYMLAAIYKEEGVQRNVYNRKPDVEKSYYYMKIAADLGHEGAQRELSRYKTNMFGKMVYQ